MTHGVAGSVVSPGASDDTSNVKDFLDQIAPFPSADFVSDYRTKSEWDDFWRSSHS